MALRNLVAAGFISSVAFCQAQTVTVAKSGTPTYSTVQDAINHFASDGDIAPNRIEITDSSVYDEMISVTVPVTIIGTGAQRPVLTPRINTAVTGATGDGLSIRIEANTTNTVVLKNLVIIPSLAAPPTDDLVMTIGQNLYLEMEDVLVTANNGSDQPISTDGLTWQPAATYPGDDGVYIGSGVAPAGEGVEVFMRNVVITHIYRPEAAGQDAVVMSPALTRSYTFSDGCVFSYCGRLGLQAGGNVVLDAPTNRIQVVGNKGFAGIWYASIIGNVRTINGVNVINNGNGTSGGMGIELQNGIPSGFTMTNAIIDGNTTTGLKISEVGNTGPINISNVTIGKSVLSDAPVIEIAGAVSSNITLTDCIIGGTGSSNPNNSIVHAGTGTLSLNGTALIGAGPYALASPPISGPGPVSGTASVTSDPQFVDVVNFTSSDYFDVSNTNYGTASSSAGPLGGGADYVGVSHVNDWSVY